MGYLEAINRRLSSPTFIIIGGRGSRICAHSFQFYSTRSPHPLSHRGEEESEGWRARFQLSRLKSSAVRALGFSTSISASRSTIPEMHTNCDGPACIIYRTSSASKDGRNYSSVRHRLFFASSKSWDFHRNTDQPGSIFSKIRRPFSRQTKAWPIFTVLG